MIKKPHREPACSYIEPKGYYAYNKPKADHPWRKLYKKPKCKGIKNANRSIQ